MRLLPFFIVKISGDYGKLRYLRVQIPGPYKAIVFPYIAGWVLRHPGWVAEFCGTSCNSVVSLHKPTPPQTRRANATYTIILYDTLCLNSPVTQWKWRYPFVSVSWRGHGGMEGMVKGGASFNDRKKHGLVPWHCILSDCLIRNLWSHMYLSGLVACCES
jgi:hypothetical protein